MGIITGASEGMKESGTWLVTGVAGFIGSHLLEELLKEGQKVTGVDNFVTGSKDNLSAVHTIVGDDQWKLFDFHEADICDTEKMAEVTKGVDFVLHQAALGSVPRSVKDPVSTNRANIDGFLSVITAAKDNGVKRFVYASSSSVYGDSPELPKVESRTGRPLSPYAVTKQVNELYAKVFSSLYGLSAVGLRYFNVFGPRQNPNGAYAAVIPRWIDEQMAGQVSVIYGDGSTSRDFCYVKNVVEANLLAATVDSAARADVYNIALGGRTTLLELFEHIRSSLEDVFGREMPGVRHEDFRAGDIMHSLADITAAREYLGYEGRHSLEEGLRETVASFRQQFDSQLHHPFSATASGTG